jgi:cbb3-type cytochrome oxidase subunit 1
MRRVSDRFLQAGVLFALLGMGLGVMMGKTEDFALAPVHAHINLLGWVSMLIYGLIYRVVPKTAQGRLPAVHFALSVLSLLAMIPTLGGYLMGDKSMAAPLGVASIVMWLSMALFAVIVFRATWKE